MESSALLIDGEYAEKSPDVPFNVWEIAKNRPREQDFDEWRTLAEVKADSALYFNVWEIA